MLKTSVLKKEFTKEINTEFTVAINIMTATHFGIDTKNFNKKDEIMVPLFIKPNYRYLKKRRDTRHAHNF